MLLMRIIIVYSVGHTFCLVKAFLPSARQSPTSRRSPVSYKTFTCFSGSGLGKAPADISAVISIRTHILPETVPDIFRHFPVSENPAARCQLHLQQRTLRIISRHFDQRAEKTDIQHTFFHFHLSFPLFCIIEGNSSSTTPSFRFRFSFFYIIRL